MGSLKRWIWGLLALYIVMVPGLVQIAGLDIPELRGWQMYGTVGIGSPFGYFIVTDESGYIRGTTPLITAMGYQRTSELQAYPGSGALKQDHYAASDILIAARSLCQQLSSSQTLAFSGRIADLKGWREMALDHNQLCASDGKRQSD